MSFGPSPSQQPKSQQPRGWLMEGYEALLGLGELAFGKGQGIRRYSLTSDGFWRVFIFATVILPLIPVFYQMLFSGHSAIGYTLIAVIGSVGSTAAACLMVIRVRGLIQAEGQGLGGSLFDLGPGTLPFLVPFLWGYAVQNIVVSVLFLIGNTSGFFLIMVILLTILVAQWRAARIGLGFSAPASVLMVLTYMISQIVCNMLILTVITMVHGGDISHLTTEPLP